MNYENYSTSGILSVSRKFDDSNDLLLKQNKTSSLTNIFNDKIILL